jgi:ABC-type polysaccharide transport system permease subunit
VIVVGVWAGMPQTTVALLAGVRNAPRELHEAAAMDGASVWRRFLTDTWPALRPVALAVTALNEGAGPVPGRRRPLPHAEMIWTRRLVSPRLAA